MASILSVAPMIQWTDVHWRHLMRRVTAHTTLYTEMVMDNAILYNPEHLENFLGPKDQFNMALQLGGSNPEFLSNAAELCERYMTFSEINLNCGCPSNKAKRAGFGAELMLEPDLVQQIMYAMSRKVTNTPLSVKCRLGVTGRESYEELVEFIDKVRSVGVRRIILHARSCVLRGLSPAQNRTIPPLKYDIVHQIVNDFPDMEIILNGGVRSFEETDHHLNHTADLDSSSRLHGVMIGREAYRNIWMFANADKRYFNKANQAYSRQEVLDYYLDYCDHAQANNVEGSNTCNLLKPLHNFFTTCTANRANVEYKHRLDELTKLYAKQDGYSVGDIVRMAVEETIPDDFLTSTGIEDDFSMASADNNDNCPNGVDFVD